MSETKVYGTVELAEMKKAKMDCTRCSVAEELDDIKRRLTLLEEVKKRIAVLEDLDDRVDQHDKEFEEVHRAMRALEREIHAARSDISRVADAQTSHGLTLMSIDRKLELLITLNTPK